MGRWKLFCIICIAGLFSSCIDSFTPELNDFRSLLVVDALLTDEDIPATVKLSRTFREADQKPLMVEGAGVFIKDDQDNITRLTETSPGLYKTDSLLFRGERGRTYQLLITTAEGSRYESDPCPLLPVQDIDDVWFERDNEIPADGSAPIPGLRFFISSVGEKECDYVRWTYREWWKFSVPYPKKFNFVNDTTFTPCAQINQVCWAHQKSYDINIRSTLTGISNRFKKLPVFFVDPQKSDRLLIRYYVLVRQMSISSDEYEFWNQMSQINEAGGDIFDKQPFEIKGNIHNVKSRNETVLGYFQVSGVKSSGIYITKADADRLSVPEYIYECNYDIKGPQDYPRDPGDPPPTLADINFWFMWAGYAFVEPVIYGGFTDTRLVFALPFCTDCTLKGSLKKPAFWVDN